MDSTTIILQQLANGIVLGFLYGLIAVGLSMVYGLLRMINFAHGDILMVGVFVALPVSALGAPFWVVLASGVAAAALAGLLVARLVFTPLLKSPDVTLLVASLGVSLFLQNIVLMLTTPQSQRLAPHAFFDQAVMLGQVILKPIDFVIVAVAVVFTVGVSAYLKFSRNGRAMRALAEDSDTARLMGVPVARLVIICFLIGSLLAGVAGVLIGQKYGHITPFMGFLPGLKAFVAAVIGGIGSFYGAILGGLILGVLEVMLVGYLPDALGQFRDAYVFLVLILVLLVRPSGLLGRAETTKV